MNEAKRWFSMALPVSTTVWKTDCLINMLKFLPLLIAQFNAEVSSLEACHTARRLEHPHGCACVVLQFLGCVVTLAAVGEGNSGGKLSNHSYSSDLFEVRKNVF